MLVVRRVLVVLLAPFVALAFFVALLGGRVDATLLNPDFLLDHARDADIYAVFVEHGIPAIVDEYIDEQTEGVGQLDEANLPTDPASRARITEVLQTFLTAEHLEAITEEVVSEVVPYMAGKSSSMDVTLSLHDSLVSTFGSAPGKPSVFEDAWSDLGLGERFVRIFSGRVIEEGLPNPDGDGDDEDDEEREHEPLSPAEEAALRALLEGQSEGAAGWLDRELFGLIRNMQPYLTGDSGEFDLSIDFTDYPALAYAFAGTLDRSPADLQRDGWRFTDRDLAERLAESQDVTIEDIDKRLAIFRAEGVTFTEDDFQERIEEGREPTDEGAALPEQRTILTNIRRAATWGAGLLTAVLVVACAFLGGRGWNGRLLWGSLALLGASLVSVVMTVPVYALAASSRIDTALGEARASDDLPLPDAVRERLFDEARAVVSEIAGGMQARAFFWFALGALGLILALAWRHPALREAVRRYPGS